VQTLTYLLLDLLQGKFTTYFDVYMHVLHEFFIMLEYTFCSDLSGMFPLSSTIGGAEGLDRIFVGGLPYYFTEVQMRELLQAFGYDIMDASIHVFSLFCILEFYLIF